MIRVRTYVGDVSLYSSSSSSGWRGHGCSLLFCFIMYLDVVDILVFILHVNIFFKFFHLREKEREINLLFHLFVCSLVDSCMCTDWGLNPQPWHSGVTL